MTAQRVVIRAGEYDIWTSCCAYWQPASKSVPLKCTTGLLDGSSGVCPTKSLFARKLLVRVFFITLSYAGLYFASMSQVYPWDHGTNFAVKLESTACKKIIQK